MPSSTILRLACQSDLASIRSCALSAYQPYVQRIGRAPAPMVADFETLIARECITVIEHESKLAGYAVFFQQNTCVHLENIAVLPEFQGLGLGKRLIQEAESYALSCGLSRVELYTNESMFENLTLYPTLGYEEIDRREEDGFRRVYFSKKL